MKLKFKVQQFQTAAVEAVVDCFGGQPRRTGLRYRIEPGVGGDRTLFDANDSGLRNADIELTESRVLQNVRAVQRRQNLPLARRLVYSVGCRYNLDVEMETGTGKTYCYIKTMFEMYERYGWSKYVVMVPSIAIREGVHKSFEITADHFMESYGRKVRFFTYNSNRLHELESFSSDAGIHVMVINIQAFNARGAANRRIYHELDDFQSRKPIDVIAGNRPILILDEPQNMGGEATTKALPKFNPLMILRYSATHRKEHVKVYRLDALDAFNRRLVKRIAVRGISTRNLPGTSAYLYLEEIEVSTRAPLARIELEVKGRAGQIKRRMRRLRLGRDLFAESGELEQYRGFTISQIDAFRDVVEFTNGRRLKAGEASGDLSEDHLRRIQIREAVRAHLDKERRLFGRGIKVLTLFFIDRVAKYRDYSMDDTRGPYARVFEEEYEAIKCAFLSELPFNSYAEYLRRDRVEDVHAGYFSIDKERFVDPKSIRRRGKRKGHADDRSAYDLILRNKERLLSQDEPVRFLFSHSALREGWDNPNVFVMCMLKHSDNTISRRQEVGRGLRISVDQMGERTDNPAIVHNVNVLTVVAGESYGEFVSNLQKEISASLSSRPRKADRDFFEGKVLRTESGDVPVTQDMAARIYHYLVKEDYVDYDDRITTLYHRARKDGTLGALPVELAAYALPIFALIDGVYSDALLPSIGDDRRSKRNPLNANFDKKAFRELWGRINRKAVYRVDFKSDELIDKCVQVLNRELRVTRLQYSVQTGILANDLSERQLREGTGFVKSKSYTETGGGVRSSVRYDLLGKIAKATGLTRRTVAATLSRIEKAVFDQFAKNPERFIAEASRIMNEQKASTIIERLRYNSTDDRHDATIFTVGEDRQEFTTATTKLRKHVYDYVVTDSKVEREFVKDLDTSDEVVVYAKLPRGFRIPTPVGDYNPDWAVSFREGTVTSVYFVAETKGSMSTLQLRKIEEMKIECARRFFDELNRSIEADNVRYDVVTDYSTLMDLLR